MKYPASDARSPFFPIEVSRRLVKPGGVPRVVNVPFEYWLAWRACMEVEPQTDAEMLAVIKSCIA